MKAPRVLAVAAATGRVGWVFFVDDQLMDWQISNKAANGTAEAATFARTMIREFCPDVVIVEEAATARHKGKHALRITAAIARAAGENNVVAITVPREHLYPNKYAEAEALLKRYPELTPWKPERVHFYDNEPRNTVIFEALALAQVMVGPRR